MKLNRWESTKITYYFDNNEDLNCFARFVAILAKLNILTSAHCACYTGMLDDELVFHKEDING